MNPHKSSAAGSPEIVLAHREVPSSVRTEHGISDLPGERAMLSRSV